MGPTAAVCSGCSSCRGLFWWTVWLLRIESTKVVRRTCRTNRRRAKAERLAGCVDHPRRVSAGKARVQGRIPIIDWRTLMDVLEHLEEEHRKVEQMIAQLEATTTAKETRRSWRIWAIRWRLTWRWKKNGSIRLSSKPWARTRLGKRKRSTTTHVTMFAGDDRTDQCWFVCGGVGEVQAGHQPPCAGRGAGNLPRSSAKRLLARSRRSATPKKLNKTSKRNSVMMSDHGSRS